MVKVVVQKVSVMGSKNLGQDRDKTLEENNYKDSGKCWCCV